ncbi:MAG: C39 family peptidase [Methanoregula sp.]|jgi:hypothetical protein
MKRIRLTLILLVLALTAMVIIPLVNAAPDTAHQNEAAKDNANHHDKDKDCHDQDDQDGTDQSNSDRNGRDKNHEDNKNCHEHQNLVSLANATIAATGLVSDLSLQSGDFADWEGATIVLDTTYSDITGTNASYSYDVMVNGQYSGYVMVSATRDNYPILEFAKGITPDKDAGSLASAKQLAQSQIKDRRQVLGDGRPLYLGATYFMMAYPVLRDNQKSKPQHISDDWIVVDLTQNKVVKSNYLRDARNYTLQLNKTEKKHWEEFQQQKIKDANAEWDALEKSTDSGSVKYAAQAVRVSSAKGAGYKNLDAPAYLWKWGCTPTSAAMVLGYFRDQGLSLPAAGDDYGDPLNRELADNMGTLYNPTGFCKGDPSPFCGMTLPPMMDVGITNELYAHDISNWISLSDLDYSYSRDTAEIDKGYPFMLSTTYFDWAQLKIYGHSVAVVGYDTNGNFLIIHNTWNTGDTYIHYGNWLVAAQNTHVYPLSTHTITASAGPNGFIVPEGSVQVPDGLNKTFIITPDTGYVVDEILVDGNPVTENPYTFEDVTADRTISATFTEISSATEWNWATDGWGDWQHAYSYSGTEVGNNGEYGPVMVGDHGEHGTESSLLAGSTQSSVWKTFTDPSGNGWNTVEFSGLLSGSDAPGGRWMTMDINGNQVFGGTASDIPPGNGVPFTISRTFPQSSTVTVKMSSGQNPAWGPRFLMQFYSVKLSNSKSLTAMAKSDNTPFVIPDGTGLVTNATSSNSP